MKYSLKNEYKSLLREFDFDAWNEYFDSYSDNEVRVVFPEDDINIARIYNTKNGLAPSKNSSELDLQKKYTLDLSSITNANTQFSKNSRSFTDKSKTHDSPSIAVRNWIIDKVNKITNKSLLNYLASNSQEDDQDFIKILEKTKNTTKNSFYLTIERINEYGIDEVKIKDESTGKVKYVDAVSRDISDDDFDDQDLDDTFAPYTEKEIQLISAYEKLKSQNIKNVKLESKFCIPTADVKFDSGKYYDLVIDNLFLNPAKTCDEIVDFIIGSQISLIEAKINSSDQDYASDTNDNYKIQPLNLEQMSLIILNEYCGNISIPQFRHDIKRHNLNLDDIRSDHSNIADAIKHLNKNCVNFLNYKGKGGGQGDVKGTGEFHVHFFLNTTNAFVDQEPDAIIKLTTQELPVSVKQYNNPKANSQTGGKMSSGLKAAFNKFNKEFFGNANLKSLNVASVLGLNKNPTETNDVEGLIELYMDNIIKQVTFFSRNESNEIVIDANKQKLCLDAYEDFKKEVSTEHGAKGVIVYYNKETPNGVERFTYIKPDECKKKVSLAKVPSNERISFNFCHDSDDSKRNRLDRLILKLCSLSAEEIKQLNQEETIDEPEEEQITSQSPENSSYIPKGKVLKEVYSHLFKKKIIKEGGLAGHMMHPYEALDMTPKQIKDRIKKYSTSQKIIEKVDGQNLFFTVEEDGTLMFARNKEDMTHDDLVEKFTNHPAEVPFISGGNAIKRGVDQWLSSAGEFGPQEILEIFHPDGEARSFINFEIMHKDHPNQIEYGENYIVFHSIVDFIDGREAVYSSNNSKRLDKLINLMKPGIESSGYTLASNRTVDLNSLTNVQISEYVSRIKDIANSLDISEDEFLGDGVQKQIQKKISELGVNISEDALNILYDFALYGEDKHGNSIKSKDFTKLMDKEDIAKLRSIGLTSASKALSFVLKTLSPFKDVFVDLGIDLLDGVPSSYMRQEVDLANIDTLREKLQTAMDDLENYMSSTPESNWDALVVRLKPHYDKVNNVGVYNAISTSVEGGVYDYQGDLLKVTGGFAPMNQILGAAYRDKKGIFPSFKQKFMQQESNRRSLRSVFSSIF